MKTLFKNAPLREIQIETIMFSGIKSLDAYDQSSEIAPRFRTKIVRWGTQHAGDCRLEFPMLEIRSNGWFTFSGNLFSSGNDDSWGILHLDLKQDNGHLLWSSGAFWSPTIGDWAPWIIDSTYPAHLFDTLARAQFWSHC